MTMILRPVLAALLVVGSMLLTDARPAFACSCRADVNVADELSQSDGAFVGVFTGRDDPLVRGEVISSARTVVNHFTVERSIKGGIGERVDVSAAAEGASCGLELSVGDRTGLLLRQDAGGWRSSLCAQVEPQMLLAVAPGRAPASVGGSGLDWGFIVFVGLLVLTIPVALVVGGAHRRAR
jgi:hypothetical protein